MVIVARPRGAMPPLFALRLPCAMFYWLHVAPCALLYRARSGAGYRA